MPNPWALSGFRASLSGRTIRRTPQDTPQMHSQENYRFRQSRNYPLSKISAPTNFLITQEKAKGCIGKDRKVRLKSHFHQLQVISETIWGSCFLSVPGPSLPVPGWLLQALILCDAVKSWDSTVTSSGVASAHSHILQFCSRVSLISSPVRL